MILATTINKIEPKTREAVRLDSGKIVYAVNIFNHTIRPNKIVEIKPATKEFFHIVNIK